MQYMKHIYLLIVYTSFIQCQNQTFDLYNLQNYATPAEFSSIKQKEQIEEDIKKFSSLTQYKKKTYHELNKQDPNLNLEITRQILNQVKYQDIQNFLKFPQEYKQSEAYKKGQVIDYDEFYDSKLKRNLKQFKNKNTLEIMKEMHIAEFDRNIQNTQNQLNFIQKETDFLQKQKQNLDSPMSFIQISETSKISALVHKFENIEINNCWASSRWEHAYIYNCANYVDKTEQIQGRSIKITQAFVNDITSLLFSSYPCNSGIPNKGNWFWLSEKLQDSDIFKEITFKGEFSTIRRIKMHSIVFITIPAQVKIEISQDLIHWENAIGYIDAPMYTDEQDNYWTWQREYDQPVYAKGVRLLLKGQRKNINGNRHGIWQFDFFSQEQTVMIMDKNFGNQPRCISRAEVGYYLTDKPFILTNCLDVILQNDSREIFFLQEYYLKQWTDKMCLSPQQKSKDQNTYITSNICGDGDNFKFIIDKLGKISLKSDPNQCLAAQNSNTITQIQQYGFVKVSATLSDSRANPYNVIDPNASGFWATPMGIQKAFYQIKFDRKYLIDEISINWKFLPQKIQISIIGDDDKWVSILNEEPSQNTLLQITPTEITGVLIEMLELKEDLSNEFSQPLYGIQKIQIKRPGQPISLQTCQYQGKESKLVNRFLLENVEYIDTSFLVPHKYSMSFLLQTYQQTKQMIELFIVQIPKFEILLKFGEYIAISTEKINQSIDQIFQSLAPFKKELLDNQNSQRQSCYGCSKGTAAINCISIKVRNSFRENGYFWIKTKCMPNPERAFCDFDSGDGNFYLYFGYYRQQQKALDLNNKELLQNHCKKLGLQSVELKNKNQIKQLIDYLNDIGANSEDDLGIPLAIRYDTSNQLEKFQSINNENSFDSTMLLNDFMIVQDQMERLIYQGADLIMLKKSKQMLFKEFIVKAQVRGLVCSENQGIIEYQKGSGFYKASCQSIIEQLNPKLNTVYKVDCPINCGDKKQFAIYGGKKYYQSESSICRSAIHSGAMKDLEGGIVEIKIVQGLTVYQGSESNEVQSLIKQGSLQDKAFEFILKPLDEYCPNLKVNSFLSFNEIIQRIKQNKTIQKIQNQEKAVSFIQSDIELKIDDEFGGGDAPLNLDQAINYISQALTKKILNQEQYLKFIKDTLELEKQYDILIQSILTSSLNPDSQKQNLQVTQQRIEATQDILDDLIKKGQAKLFKNFDILQFKSEDYHYLLRYEPFFLDYLEDIMTINEIFDNSLVKNGPSSWKYIRDDVYPHKQAVSQFSEISCKNSFEQPDGDCTATILGLKFKKFYDFSLQIDFKARKYGFLGIIFRQQDLYNYYALEFQNTTVQIRKMVNGVQKIIATQRIDKILQDAWYNVDLTVQQTIFQVKLGKEKNYLNQNKYQELTQVLQAQDETFKSGYQAIFTDGTQAAMFDGYKINPIDCWKDQFDINKAIKYQPPFSSRFKEKYLGEIIQVWNQNLQLPNQFIYKNGVYSRKTVLYKQLQAKQKSKSFIILQNKVFKEGWIGFDFYKESQFTQISLFFYYINEINYCEFSIDKDKIVIKQVENGNENYYLLQKKEDIKIMTWYKIYFQITMKLNVWIEEDKPNSIRYELLEKQVDKPIVEKGFQIGFNIQKGTGAIDNIQMQPGLVPEKESDDDENSISDNFDELDQTSLIINYDDDLCQQNPQSCLPQIDYQQCTNSKKYSQKQQWCQILYGGLIGPTQNCIKNFCSQCCEQKVPFNQKAVISKCLEECKPQEPDDSYEWKQCISSNQPKQAVQNICPMQYLPKQKKQIKQCKLDFCYLCCSLNPLVINKGLPDRLMQDCNQECSDKYNK